MDKKEAYLKNLIQKFNDSSGYYLIRRLDDCLKRDELTADYNDFIKLVNLIFDSNSANQLFSSLEYAKFASYDCKLLEEYNDAASMYWLHWCECDKRAVLKCAKSSFEHAAKAWENYKSRLLVEFGPDLNKIEVYSCWQDYDFAQREAKKVYEFAGKYQTIARILSHVNFNDQKRYHIFDGTLDFELISAPVIYANILLDKKTMQAVKANNLYNVPMEMTQPKCAKAFKAAKDPKDLYDALEWIGDSKYLSND